MTTESALAGSYGMQAVINDNNDLTVADWTPYGERRYRARFRFDPNSISMTNGDMHKILEAVNADKGVAVMMYFGYTNGQYWVAPVALTDSLSGAGGANVTISDAPHILELDWQAASAPGANDGHLTFWVDGTQQWNVTGVDNDTRRVDTVSLGPLQGIDSGTRGTYYFDSFVSRRESYIGTVGYLPSAQLGQAPQEQGAVKLAALAPYHSDDSLAEPVIRPSGVLAPTTLTAASSLLAPLASRPGAVHPAPQAQGGGTTITYTYDPLYRLTAAEYSTGDSFEYAYDAVGNRLTETTCIGQSCTPTTTNYIYDNANRLTSVGGVSYTWDDNGNLLSDGVNTYAYNHANRLTAFSNPQSAVSFAYNGQGDRLQQTVDNVTTTYTLDLNAGLTQVLADGTNAYLYGAGRIAQQSGAGKEYFLSDALGSVRQLAGTAGLVSLTKSYQPYGSVLESDGSGTTSYGFAGEHSDAATGLEYLRARYYAPQSGRFLSKDAWPGDYNEPMSFNAWLYGYDNPVLFIDPSGFVATKVNCDAIYLPDLRYLCRVANLDDQDPIIGMHVLDARKRIFRKIAEISRAASLVYGEGYWWAGVMLDHFLDRDDNVRVNLPSNTTFDIDYSIARAVWKKQPAISDNEPLEITPLLYRFLLDYIQPQIDVCTAFQMLPSYPIQGKTTYSGSTDPRPKDRGWWGAFGHVVINAAYSDIAIRNYSNGYSMINVQVDYTVKDQYVWYGGQKQTPLPLGVPYWKDGKLDFYLVDIPHDWEDSLVASGDAKEYDFNIFWSDTFSIAVDPTFSWFALGGNGKNEVLRLK